MFKIQNVKDLIYPTVVFAGGMIGVGFLSLPYVASKTSIWLMLLYFVMLTAIVLVVNLIFAEVSLKTPDFKRFPGFAAHHLGRWGGVFAMLCTILGTFGILLACLIVGSKFLASILIPMFGGNLLVYTLLYVSIGGVLIFFGIKMIKRVELLIVGALLLAITAVFFAGFSHINIDNLLAMHSLDIKSWFLPFGPILFSLWGITMIPEIEEMLIGKKDNLKKVIFLSTIAVALVYVLFVIVVLGISGNQTTESAFLGLRSLLGSNVVTLALFVGVMTTMTGFITQGVSLKNVFVYDLKIKPWQAVVFTCLTPLILFLMGINSFVSLVSVLGGFILGISGILILLMYRKIGGKNIVVIPLSLVFLLGAIYQVIFFIKP